MIFEKYRRDRWLKKIEATFGPLDALEENIHALESQHLLSIAKITKRIGEYGSFNKNILRLLLKILGKDAVLAKELAVTDENKFSKRLDQLVEEQKKDIINKAKEQFSAKIPEGDFLILKMSVALSEVTELLSRGIEQENQIYDYLHKRFLEQPESIFTSYEEWKTQRIRNLAQVFFNEKRPQLEQVLPDGCSVNETACVDAFTDIIIGSRNIDLFKQEIPHNDLSKQFEEKFRNDENFICGFKEWRIRRQQQVAEAAFEEIRSKIEPDFPEGCKIYETVCLDVLKKIIIDLGDIDLFNREIPQNKIVTQFDEQFQAEPERFIEWKIQKRQKFAEAILNTIRSGVERKLLEGCSINETVCLSTLDNIILDSGWVEDLTKNHQIPYDIFDIFRQFGEQFYADPDFFILGFKEWNVQKRQQLAETLFREMRPRLEQELIEGHSLEETACIEALGQIIHDLGCFDLFRHEIPYDEIIKLFDEQFHTEPERFISGFADWDTQTQQKLAEALLNTMRPGLKGGLIEGWNVNETGCIEALGKIIHNSGWVDLFKNNQIPYDIFNIFRTFNISKQFNEQLHANLEPFV
ncbi:MAG: hypothetical protein GY797_30435, partial [Deltaproteobacteria bacterium]|nr:hypothetical protein [Deltaproteobacteria bacterium]